MNRRCKRCKILMDINDMRWSKIFRGFVCSNRQECTKRLYEEEEVKKNLKTIIMNKDNKYTIPKRHRLTEENRRLTIKTQGATVIHRLLKDGREQIDWRNVKLRDSHKGLIEINGEFFKVKKK